MKSTGTDSGPPTEATSHSFFAVTLTRLPWFSWRPDSSQLRYNGGLKARGRDCNHWESAMAAIVVNRMGDRIGFALIGAAIGYIISCCLPPAGWALVVPVFSLLIGTRLDIFLIMTVAIIAPAFVTAWLARLCP